MPAYAIHSTQCELQPGMVHHDLQLLFFRQLNQFLRLGHVAGEGLFHKGVFAVLQRTLCQVVVVQTGVTMATASIEMS